VQGTSRSELAAELERCARLCEDTAAAYAESDGVHSNVVSALLLAAAAMETAFGVVDEGGTPAATALLITQTLARDAIDAAERRGLDAALLHCVTACRRVIQLCDEAL
jgi:hypothetical protein